MSAAELPQILLVADSEASATLLSHYLSGRFNVIFGPSDEEAWNLLRTNPRIELVVADIHVARLSGLRLLKQIRASENSEICHLPVIVMTGTDDARDRNLAFDYGASDFITKPVEPIELQARVTVHQKLSRTFRELEASRNMLQQQATTDSLTGLKNRRAFFDVGVGHLAYARRHSKDLSVIAIDVDHFKEVNDTFGHQTGDAALVTVAQTLRSSIRAEDTPARIGGEEFAVLLPDTSRVGAAVLAERIRAALQRKQIPVAGQIVSLTVSAGIASYESDDHGDLEQLMGVADKRLYLAKQYGRNRVVVAD